MKAVPSIISVYRITSYGKKLLLTRVLLWICVDILPDILALKQPAPPQKKVKHYFVSIRLWLAISFGLFSEIT